MKKEKAKVKTKKTTILVDIHNTILNGDGINQIVVDAIKGFVKIGYSIVVFTADRLEEPEKTNAKILKAGVIFEEFYYPDHSATFQNEDDAAIKEILYDESIKHIFDIKLLIDNSKDVCKLFNKELKIPVMRFKAPKNEIN
jgi:hypothetical protein